MFGKQLKSAQVWEVDNLEDFFSYNHNFLTDGKVYVAGNKKIEFKVENAKFIFVPEKKLLLINKREVKIC